MRILSASVAFSILFLIGLGCASSSSETSSTQVDGPFAADEIDWDREISDEEVTIFARAYLRVMAVQRQYHTRIQQAQGTERQELIEESEGLIDEIITSEGMTAQDYNAIALRLPDDDELRRRVSEALAAHEEERRRLTEEEL